MPSGIGWAVTEEISRINGAGSRESQHNGQSRFEEVATVAALSAAFLAGLRARERSSRDWFLLSDALLSAPSPRGAKANGDPAASQAASWGSRQETVGCCQMLWTGPVALHPVQMSERELKVNRGLWNQSIKAQERKEIIQELYSHKVGWKHSWFPSRLVIAVICIRVVGRELPQSLPRPLTAVTAESQLCSSPTSVRWCFCVCVLDQLTIFRLFP